MKKIIFPIIFILISCFIVYQVHFRKPELNFRIVEVVRGNVSQEVTETGKVKKGEKIDLSFKMAGKIEKIWVKEGEKVKEGDILAKLDNKELKIQLKEAKASLELYQAKLDKLLAGPTEEEIQLAQTKVENAKTSLESAKQSLEDVKSQAAESLSSAYEDALNVLDAALLKAVTSQNTVDEIEREYFTISDQESNKVKEQRNAIKNAVSEANTYLNIAKETSNYEDIDAALLEMREALSSIYEALKIIRETCDSLSYKNLISPTDKTTLDNQKSYINTALGNVINAQQAISQTKINNEANINTAKSKVEEAEGALKAAKDELSLLIAPPRQEDIDLYQAQVNQAKSQINLLENQIQDTILISPTQGQIIKINKRAGEIVQPMLGEVVISLLPAEPLQIEVDIPEAEIGKIEIGDPCKITLDAFPEKEFSGKVIEIEPSATIIQGVVYYRVKTSLDGEVSKIKPGMTANVTIISERKENVLIIPQRAVIERSGKKFVRVPSGDTFEEIEVQTGLKGSGGEIEIISGLEEGDKVITFIKKL